MYQTDDGCLNPPGDETRVNSHEPHRGVDMQRGVNVLALVKENERYVFLYDEESAATLLRTLGKYAGDRELSFSWYDAAVLSQKVRRLSREAKAQADTLEELDR